MADDLDRLPDLAAELAELCRLANTPDVRAYRHAVDRLAPVLKAYGDCWAVEAPSGDDAGFGPDRSSEPAIAQQRPAGADGGMVSDHPDPDLPTRQCDACGAPFPVISKTKNRKRFCSTACQQRINGLRQRERRSAARQSPSDNDASTAAPDHQDQPAQPASQEAKPELKLAPRKGSPFQHLDRPKPVTEPNANVDQALADIGRMPPATAMFEPGSRRSPPAVAYEPARPEPRARGASLAI